MPSSYFNNNDPNRIQPERSTWTVQAIDGEAFVIQCVPA